MLGPAPAKPGQGPRPPGSVARGRRPRARWAIARAGELRPRRLCAMLSTPGQWRLPDDGDYQWSRRARGERRGSARQSRRFEGALGTRSIGSRLHRGKPLGVRHRTPLYEKCLSYPYGENPNTPRIGDRTCRPICPRTVVLPRGVLEKTAPSHARKPRKLRALRGGQQLGAELACLS